MEESLKLAAEICGTEETDETLMALVRAAECCLTMALGEGVSPEDCGESFPAAVAIWASGVYKGSKGGGNVTGFSAGNVSLSLEASADSARESALELLSPWLRDRGFSFKGV